MGRRMAEERLAAMAERLGVELPQHQQDRERRLAQAILSMADQAGMPDSWWETDWRCVLAREVLEVPRDGRNSHAHLWSYE